MCKYKIVVKNREGEPVLEFEKDDWRGVLDYFEAGGQGDLNCPEVPGTTIEVSKE